MQPPLACVLPQFLRQHKVPVSARLAVALSGGPDSLALAILLSDHHKHIHGDGAHVRKPLALVVDHALRAGSAGEASTAAEQARGLGLSPRVLALTWPQGRPSGGRLLAEAREARYRALAGACRAEGCAGLLLGHHAGTTFGRGVFSCCVATFRLSPSRMPLACFLQETNWRLF